MNDFNSDFYLLNGILVHSRPDASTALGLGLTLPALATASEAARNAAGDAFRSLIQAIPEGRAIQVRWETVSDYAALLDAYDAETRKIDRPLIRGHRDRQSESLRALLRRGALRRQQVSVYLQGPAGPARLWSSSTAHADSLRVAAQDFDGFRERVRRALSPIQGDVQVLSTSDITGEFWRRLNPQSPGACPLHEPGRGLLDQCFSGDIRGLGSRGFYMGDRFHGVRLLQRLAASTYTTSILGLTELPFGGFEIIAHVRRLRVADVMKKEQRALDRARQVVGHSGDERLRHSLEQREQRLRRFAEGGAVPVSLEFTIIASDESEQGLSRKLDAIRAAVREMGEAQTYEASLATTARNAFLRTMPGCFAGGGAAFELVTDDATAANLLPLSASFSGDLDRPHALYRGSGSNLVGIRLFSADDSVPLSCVIIGASRFGKSVFEESLKLQADGLFDYRVVIDFGESHRQLARAHGVETIVFQLDSGQCVNLFDSGRQLPLEQTKAVMVLGLVHIVGLPADEEAARHREALLGCKVGEMLADVAEDRLRAMPASKRLRLVRLALLVARVQSSSGLGADEAFNELRFAPDLEARLQSIPDAEAIEFESREPERVAAMAYAHFEPYEFPTLSTLVDHLELGGGAEPEQSRRLATLLRPWCRGGRFGSMFDGPSTVSLAGPMVSIELGRIPETAASIRNFVGTLFLGAAIQRFKTMPRAVKKSLMIEELARFLDVPGGARILQESFQQLAKYNVHITVVLQQLSQINQPKLLSAILGNCRQVFAFNPVDKEDLEILVRHLGLSSVAKETILAYPRPDQLGDAKFSSCMFFRPGEAACGTIRHFLLPTP